MNVPEKDPGSNPRWSVDESGFTAVARSAQRSLVQVQRARPRLGPHGVGVALMLGAAVLWSTGGVGIKSAGMPALALAGWRGLFALPVLLLLLLAYGRAAQGAAPAALRAPGVWIGAVAYVV